MLTSKLPHADVVTVGHGTPRLQATYHSAIAKVQETSQLPRPLFTLLSSGLAT